VTDITLLSLVLARLYYFLLFMDSGMVQMQWGLYFSKITKTP